MAACPTPTALDARRSSSLIQRPVPAPLTGLVPAPQSPSGCATSPSHRGSLLLRSPAPIAPQSPLGCVGTPAHQGSLFQRSPTHAVSAASGTAHAQSPTYGSGFRRASSPRCSIALLSSPVLGASVTPQSPHSGIGTLHFATLPSAPAACGEPVASSVSQKVAAVPGANAQVSATGRGLATFRAATRIIQLHQRVQHSATEPVAVQATRSLPVTPAVSSAARATPETVENSSRSILSPNAARGLVAMRAATRFLQLRHHAVAEKQAPSLAVTTPISAVSDRRTSLVTPVLNPLSVRFSQARINPSFSDGAEFQGAIDECMHVSCLVNGKDRVFLRTPFPPIEVVAWRPKLRNPDGTALKDSASGAPVFGDERWFTMDNRRLYCLQRAALAVWPRLCCMSVNIIESVPGDRKIMGKFKTTTEGASICVGHAKDAAEDCEVWDFMAELNKAAANNSGHEDAAELLASEAAGVAPLSALLEASEAAAIAAQKAQHPANAPAQTTACGGGRPAKAVVAVPETVISANGWTAPKSAGGGASYGYAKHPAAVSWSWKQASPGAQDSSWQGYGHGRGNTQSKGQGKQRHSAAAATSQHWHGAWNGQGYTTSWHGSNWGY
eukprot:TRINITY_DN18981_c0_g1_i1.p1 TRINITY_DN18981_c0_g1~~TRINITY_DN18981_c0_g1_i1.p1  ORF type:complete len:612 (+),score=86.48 TRINITY_DN18981_c0_g1_i1:60-1895(+)